MAKHDVATEAQRNQWRDIAAFWRLKAETAGDDEVGQMVAAEATARAEVYEGMANAAFVVVGR